MDNAERQTMNGKPVLYVPVKTVLNFQSGFLHKLLCDGISEAWEQYNRETFLAHAKICQEYGPGKLRYLTYVKESTRGWWEKYISKGAVIL
jgi:hypothetical protein